MSIPTYIIAAKQLQREISSKDDDYIKELVKKHRQERKGTMLGLLNNQHPLNFTKILDNL